MSTTTTSENTLTKAIPYPLSVIKQAISVVWLLDMVAVLWGPVGWTKSSTIKSLATDLDLPLHDVRLSDKEPTDLGGIPFPIDTISQVTGEPMKSIRYLVTDLLPFEDIYGPDYECVLFFDEVDRSSVDTLNAWLQLTLDRGINGRKLCQKTRIICAGNGITDTGTTELTKAAATRLCHFYVKTTGASALDHWVDWATAEGIDPALVGFSQLRPELFGGSDPEYIEIQSPNPRTFTWAAKALESLATLPFSPEVGDAVLFGLVGQAAGREYSAYRSILSKCPTLKQVIADPAKAELPPEENVGVIYALGSAFMAHLYDPAAEKDVNPEVNPKHTAAVAAYFARLALSRPETREAVVWFMRTASTKLPSMAGLAEFQAMAA